MTYWHEVQSGRYLDATAQLWNAFGDDADVVTSALLTRPLLAGRIADFVRADIDATATFDFAREIMGRNFFGLKEAAKYFRISYGSKEKAQLAVIPFTAEMLRECKDTHILIAVFPISVWDIRIKVGYFADLVKHDSEVWYRNENFALNEGRVRWQLIRKTHVEGSLDSTWREQSLRLRDYEDVPHAQVLVYTILGHFLATGERLFKDVYVRCTDSSDDSRFTRVYIGCFKEGLQIDCSSNNDRGSIGIASAVTPMRSP